MAEAIFYLVRSGCAWRMLPREFPSPRGHLARAAPQADRSPAAPDGRACARSSPDDTATARSGAPTTDCARWRARRRAATPSPAPWSWTARRREVHRRGRPRARLRRRQAGCRPQAARPRRHTAWLLQALRQKGIVPVIPSRSDQPGNPDFAREVYRKRNRAERLVGKRKQFRRVATRYDQLDVHYLAFIQLASAMVWLRSLGGTVQCGRAGPRPQPA
jgi:transposase